jgi:uncharacterized protein
VDGSEVESTHPNPTVTVKGVGIAPVRPDGVRVGLTVRHRADSADGALAEAARKSQALERLFLELGIDRERWVTAGLGLEEWTEWDEPSRREVRRGYIGSSRVVVTLPDADSLGRLLAEAVVRTQAAVEGPHWNIAPENPAHDESRRRAMADALRRAETYAEAAGLVLGALIEVVEAGPGHPRRTMGLPVRAAGLADAAPEMPAHAEGLQIVAEVHVTYLLTRA